MGISSSTRIGCSPALGLQGLNHWFLREASLTSLEGSGEMEEVRKFPPSKNPEQPEEDRIRHLEVNVYTTDK